MKSPADRALDLCRAYDALSSEIKTLTRLIGECLGQCPRSLIGEAGIAPRSTKKGLPYTHLSEAFELHEDNDSEYFYKHLVALDEDEKTEVLAACPHCQTAYRHVKDRRAAKQRLGVVKRAIRSIGRSNP
jgi:hypothetical protein